MDLTKTSGASQAADSERESCAQIADREQLTAVSNGWAEYQRAAHNIAVLIRSRGSLPTANSLKFTDTEMLEWIAARTDFGLFCERYNTTLQTSSESATVGEWRRALNEAMSRDTPETNARGSVSVIGHRPFGNPLR